MLRARLVVTVFASLVAPAFAGDPAPTASAPAKPVGIQLGDLFDMEWADAPEISPDGSRIVFERHAGDIMKDRYASDLWIIGSDGSGLEPLTTGGASGQATWSPDGTRLCYASAADGSYQLWVRWLASGRATRITNVQQAPIAPTWSPDGKWIAFLMFVPSPAAAPYASMPAKPEGAEWGKPARLIQKTYYRADGAGYLEDGFQQIFVVPADGGTARALTTEARPHDAPIAWTPDGNSILFAANRVDDRDFDPVEAEICELSVADGTIKELTHRDGPDRSPAISPDGKTIAWVGFDDRQQGYQVAHLSMMNRDGSDVREVTAALDRDVEQPTWAADGSGVFFRFDDRGNTKVGFATRDGKVTTLASDVGGTSISRPYASGSFSVDPRGDVAFTMSRPEHPSDVAFVPAGGAARRLTHLNDDIAAIRKLGDVQPMTWKSSFDQREIAGWVVTPPEFDAKQKYPLILEIHGGPFANYGDRFAFEMQAYAAAGYVVLYTNPRGSTSYGEEFGNLIHHDYPNHDFEDLMSGVDALIARGSIDADNLFVTGGSGGGALTAWIVGHTDRFRAAVSCKPVINWQSFVLTADETAFFIRYWFPASPWDDPAGYAKRSPLTYVGNVKTPTMLITGEADYRTPISESEQFYEALRQRKIDAALVRIPDASHGMDARPTQLIAKLAHIIAWFDKHRAPAK